MRRSLVSRTIRQHFECPTGDYYVERKIRCGETDLLNIFVVTVQQ
jgi:hypothetical protein